MPKSKGYWLTTMDIARVYGIPPSTFHSRMKKDLDHSFLPPEERKLGRSKVWDRLAFKRFLGGKGIEVPEFYSSLGLKKPLVDEGDELLDIDDVMSIFDYTSRPEFQARVREGALPPPDYRYQRPFPSFWLKSSIERWVERRKATLSYKRLGIGHYQASYGTKTIGEVKRFVHREETVRSADGELVDRTVYRWRREGPDGTLDMLDSRKDAATILVEKARAEGIVDL